MSAHKLLQKLILNRDKLFTSRFWRALMAQLNIKHKLSTVYYLQTDRQTERMNQTLK